MVNIKGVAKMSTNGLVKVFTSKKEREETENLFFYYLCQTVVNDYDNHGEVAKNSNYCL